jgi:hypothetical protein
VPGDKNCAARADADDPRSGIAIVIGIDADPCGAVVATGIAGAAGPAFVDPLPPPQPAIASVAASTARCRIFIILLDYWTVMGWVAEFGTHCSVVVPIVPVG